MKKIDLNKQKKRDSLLNSAFQLFTKDGYGHTSISDIVSNAGVAKGTFYLYFADKFDLRNKLIAHKANQVFMAAFQALDEEAIPDFEDQMIFLVNHVLDQCSANRQMVDFISKHLSWAFFKNSLTEESQQREEGSSLEAFRRLLAKANYTYRNPEVMLFMIIEFAGGTSYNAILYQQPVTLEELKPRIFSIVRAIMREERENAPAGDCPTGRTEET